MANKECPMAMGESGEVSSITFNGTDVVYILTMNEDYINLDALGKTPEAMKSAVTAIFRNPKGDTRTMLELVIETNSGIEFTYKGAISGKEVKCHLGTEELNFLLNVNITEKENEQKKLEELVNMTNISCPMNMDESTVLDKLTIEPDKVVYHYTIDEKELDIASLKGNTEEMKQNVRGSLSVSDPALKLFLEACVKNNKALSYSYTGNTSGENIELFFSVAEVKTLL